LNRIQEIFFENIFRKELKSTTLIGLMQSSQKRKGSLRIFYLLFFPQKNNKKAHLIFSLDMLLFSLPKK